MAGVDQRDFFISFNSADLAYAEAIDAALRAAGFTTHFHPRDLGAGGNIPIWMDEALMASAQTLALYSPDYMKDTAVYSRAERYATWWQDPGDDRRKLIPILLRDTTLTPLMAPISRIEVMGLTPKEAAARVVTRLKTSKETEQRGRWRKLQPLPKIFHAPYRPNPNFTGRFEALENLHRALGDHATVAVTAIAGIGGVGKTTLAAEYCHRFGGQYGGVWTIRAEEPTVMLADIQELAKELGVGDGQNTETDAKAALNYLKSETHPWLLVYDNAPNPDAVRKWLPVGAVRCLITSRFAEFGDVAAVTRLDFWSPAVTADYLLSRTGRTDAAGAARLARAVGDLPLAAEQAAAYLAPRTGMSFDDYAADIARLISRPRPSGAMGDYPDTVYAAFVKSLETLQEIESGEIAVDVVCLCAFLSPDGVDLALLTVEWRHQVLPPAIAAAMNDKTTREDALAALISLSLLRREGGAAGPILIFHRLLLAVTREWMGEHGRELWGNAAAQLVNAAFPYEVPDPSNWQICARLVPHVAPLEANVSPVGLAAEALGRLLNQASLYLSERGDRAGALVFAERGVALARLGGDTAKLGIRLHNLALHYTDVGRLDDAERICREALEILESHLDINDSGIARAINSLAQVHWKRMGFDKAETLLLRASVIRKAVHGSESAEYGKSLANLGAVYCDWADRPGQAERRRQEENYKTQALTVTRAARGERHPETAIQRSNFALMKAKMGEWSRAIPEAKRALAIMLSLGLARHPYTKHMVGSSSLYARAIK